MDELLVKLWKILIIYYKDLYYTKKTSKLANNKVIKPKNYDFHNKIWLNRKYIKNK